MAGFCRHFSEKGRNTLGPTMHEFFVYPCLENVAEENPEYWYA